MTAYGGNPQRHWIRGFDPSTLARQDTVITEGGPSWEVGGGGIAYGEGTIWVVGTTSQHPVDGRADAVLTRVDPATDQVTSIRLGGYVGADVAVAASGVWAAYFGEGEGPAGIAQIEAATDTVIARFSLGNDYVRQILPVAGKIVVEELVWDGTGPNSILESIDPNAHEVGATSDIRIDVLRGMVAWHDQLWVMSRRGALRLDPGSLEPIGDPVHGVCCFLNSSDDGVWLVEKDGQGLALLDPHSGIVQRFPTVKVRTSAATAGPDALWLLDWDATLTKIELNRATR